jgi:hypothetical protein
MRYYFNAPGIPHLVAGALLVFVPLWGIWDDRNVALRELPSVLVLWLPAALILLGRRGISFHGEKREFRRWYGLGFTRSLALPIWRTAPKRFQFVAVRYKPSYHPKTPGSSISVRTPAVWMVDEQEKWTAVGSAWTTSGAHRMAKGISDETGLPLRSA